ncbi:MAG: hypothetical protein RQ899_12000 [Pseudomonadales bacterium]|nr:hypothetical protein [Pseudomonadales bacterium]
MGHPLWDDYGDYGGDYGDYGTPTLVQRLWDTHFGSGEGSEGDTLE